jgi:hypothetical protein
MSIFTRLSNLFTKEIDATKKIDAYAFEKTVFTSIDDYVLGGGCIITTIYVPSYGIYAHYYNDMKEFIPYKLDEAFNENNEQYVNVRKIKISSSFCEYLCDWYEMREGNKKWCDKNKSYFDNITK